MKKSRENNNKIINAGYIVLIFEMTLMIIEMITKNYEEAMFFGIIAILLSVSIAIKTIVSWASLILDFLILSVEIDNVKDGIDNVKESLEREIDNKKRKNGKVNTTK